MLIADDHAPTRAGVRTALEHGGCEVCAEAANADGRDRRRRCASARRLPARHRDAGQRHPRRRRDQRAAARHADADAHGLARPRPTCSTRCGRAPSATCSRTWIPTRLPDAVAGAPPPARACSPASLTARADRGVPAPARGRRTAHPRPTAAGSTSRRASGTCSSCSPTALSTAEIAQRLFLSPVTVRRHVSMRAAQARRRQPRGRAPAARRAAGAAHAFKPLNARWADRPLARHRRREVE